MYWGKGTTNNSIGWGKGADNNSIGWGSVYPVSSSGDTDIQSGLANTVAPAISGTNEVGETLTCTTGTWSGGNPITYAYQWKRDGVSIGAATNSTYVLISADAETDITCTVTATNSEGSNSATSNTITIAADVDADAQAFITAASITDPTQQSAVNQLVLDLKSASIWTKMKRIYPMIGGNASSCSVDLKSLTTGTFYGGWSYTAGALPNGSTGYFDTGFNPSVSATLNDEGIGFALNTNNAAILPDPVDMGAYASPVSASLILSKADTTTRLNGNPVTVAQATRIGFFSAQKVSATVTNLYKNGTQVATGNSGGSLPNSSIFIGNMNFSGSPYGNGYTNNNFTFAFISSALDATENTNLYNAVTTFNTTLGR